MNTSETTVPIWLDDAATSGWLDQCELARACHVGTEFIGVLIEEGLLEPVHVEPDRRFGSTELARVQRITRLQRDFEASLPSIALMLDLLDEIADLRLRLRHARAV